jgi:hypothetical protein
LQTTYPVNPKLMIHGTTEGINSFNHTPHITEGCDVPLILRNPSGMSRILSSYEKCPFGARAFGNKPAETSKNRENGRLTMDLSSKIEKQDPPHSVHQYRSY